MALALVAVVLLISMAVPVRAWLAQRAQIADLREQVDAATERVDALQVQKKRWNDPAFVAAQARDRLHFVLRGEVGYVTVGAPAAAATALDPGQSTDQPWYATLWSAVQEADDHASPPAPAR